MTHPVDPPQDAGPPTPAHGAGVLGRIGVLDVLRGLALIGMYVVHFHNYSEPGGDFAHLQDRIIALFFEERFYAMFGMLFGVGFAIQLARADARGEPFTARFLRRMFGLAVFGFIAEGVFGYNVLFGYAMWGVPLLLVRRWPTRRLVVLVVLCAASVPLINLIKIAGYSTQPDGMARFAAASQARWNRFQAARDTLEQAEASTDFRTVVAGRMRFMPKFERQWNLLPGGSFTLFLLGLLGFRLGLFDRPEAHRRLIAGLMLAGAASWALAMFVFPIGPPLTPGAAPTREGAGAVLEAAVTILRVNGFRLFRDQWLAFTYIGAVLLLVVRDRRWLDRLSPLAWTGRMALTNYMAQIILLDLLFEPYGMSLKVAPAMVPIGALALFGAQAAAGRWWLTRFTIGPLEWVWRSFTAWQIQGLRHGVESREA